MKKITFILTFIATVIIAVSCDKIEGPYLQYDESVETTVEFPELDKNTLYKKVLVEEFTGHRCSNCPEGHRLLASLAGNMGDTLVCVCIHAGTLARRTSAFPYDFTTTEGTELYEGFSVVATPRAVFNQSQFNGGYAVSMSNWAQAVEHFKQGTPIAAIQMINEFSGGTLTAHTKTTFLTDYDEPVKLALYVLEDGIVSPQIDGIDTTANYVHNHVMRGSLNGTYGTFISDNGTVMSDSSYTKSYQLVCAGKDWVPAHCSVVAILTNATTKEVLQVEKCPFLHE